MAGGHSFGGQPNLTGGHLFEGQPAMTGGHSLGGQPNLVGRHREDLLDSSNKFCVQSHFYVQHTFTSFPVPRSFTCSPFPSSPTDSLYPSFPSVWNSPILPSPIQHESQSPDDSTLESPPRTLSSEEDDSPTKRSKSDSRRPSNSRRVAFSPQTIQILENWYAEHIFKFPYATARETEMLAELAGITFDQVRKWLCNRRARCQRKDLLWKRMPWRNRPRESDGSKMAARERRDSSFHRSQAPDHSSEALDLSCKKKAQSSNVEDQRCGMADHVTKAGRSAL